MLSVNESIFESKEMVIVVLVKLRIELEKGGKHIKDTGRKSDILGQAQKLPSYSG